MDSAAGMSSLLGTAYVMIRGDMSQLPNDLSRAGGRIKEAFTLGGVSSELARFGAASLAAYGPVALLDKAVERFSENAAEGSRASEAFEISYRRLRTVIASTGRVENAAALKKFALEMEDSVGASGRGVMEFQSHLLQFNKVQGEVFDRATKVAIDWAEVWGEDIPSKARVLGMSLQDPIRGMSMLRRAQIQLTESQQTEIKHLITTNQLFEAQDIILKALEARFGGAAEKMVSPIKKLRSELETELRMLGDELRKHQPLTLRVKIELVKFQRGAMEGAREIGRDLNALGLGGLVPKDFEAEGRGLARVGAFAGVGAGIGSMAGGVGAGPGAAVGAVAGLWDHALHEWMRKRNQPMFSPAAKEFNDFLRNAKDRPNIDADRRKAKLEGLYDPMALISKAQEVMLDRGEMVELGPDTKNFLEGVLDPGRRGGDGFMP